MVTAEKRLAFLKKAENELKNLIISENLNPTAKLSLIDDLTNAYKFQLKKAIEEGLA